MSLAAGPSVREQPVPPPVTRHMSPGVELALQQFANPEVLASGKVNVIALDAVAERFGNRWAMRREQVHDHVQATLDRQLGSQGYHLRISEMDVLVCQPHMGRLSGQAFCLRLLREILHHFLGESGQADIGVHEVLGLSPDGAQVRRVDAAAAYAAEESGPGRGAAPGAPTTDPATLGAVDIWTPFVAANGRQIEVSCALDPVRELKGGANIGVRLSRRVTDAATGAAFDPSELARLSRSDRLRIDLGGMVQGLNLLRELGAAARPLVLIVPVSFSSLSNIDGRARIVSAFQHARAYAAQGVIGELCEIDGVPATTMFSAAAMIRPFSLFLIGHVSELDRSLARPLRDAGLRGVSMTCPANLTETQFLGWAKATIGAAKGVANAVLIYELASERERELVRVLGATHGHVAAG